MTKLVFRSLIGALLCSATPALCEDRLAPGVWTNMEDEYFAEEEGREKPTWMGLRVADDGRWQRIDAFGEPLAFWRADAIPGLAPRDGGGWEVDGSELRLARPFTCWMSVRKHAAKPDGSADWDFVGGLTTFDQGGRVRVGGNGSPEATVLLRNVTWAHGSRNKPALVLYVHKDDPGRAVSYGWAAPDSSMIGINLRWIQGSCSRDDASLGATEASLVAAGETWRQLYEAGDWQAIRALYADDAVLMTADQPKIEGADAIVGFLKRLSEAGAAVTFAFAPEETVVAYPLGHVTAKYRMEIAFPGSEPATVAGRSFLVYKWQDGGWKLWRDIDNFAPDVTPEGVTSDD